MARTADNEGSVLAALRELQQHAGGTPREPLRRAVAEAAGRLARAPLDADAASIVDAAVAFCRGLYAQARSSDGLPLARALLERCMQANDSLQSRRAAIVCGLLAADSGDLVSALEYHVQALRLASRDEDHVEASRVWINIGAAIAITGNYEMSVRCYRRAVALVEHEPGPVSTRYNAYSNLASNYFQLGRYDEGVRCAERAIDEMTPAFVERDPHNAILLRRNLVRLMLALGKVPEARAHAEATVALADRVPSPRARIAADIARASVEIATGHADLALTRLDRALATAREIPATLRDTLICAIRAEEAAGNTARALMRLQELSGFVYAQAIDKMRQHVELSGVRVEAGSALDSQREQTLARLTSQLEPPTPPEGWKTLQRLAVGAAMRMDPTGWHGVRVGAMVKSLALATGSGPLQALELGLAAEVHDIGLASVPEGIFRRRGGLNPSERRILLRHADAGSELLRDDTHPRMFLAREIAQYHHARWDGTGHPDGVAGPAIPLGARMCGIADAYDAMVCGLAGHPPRSMGDALKELRAQAGKQFDPELVSCFDSLVRDEVEGRGMDLSSGTGMEGFQELISSLQEDRGFV